MERLSLVASHLSSVFASSAHVATHAVPTSRRDIPLATTNSDIPDGHALHSSFSHTRTGGDVLIRIVQGGLAVELVSLSTSVSPIRFLFPAPIVPTPSLVPWEDQLHLLVLTSVGSLFRIILPVYENGLLWNEPLRKDWCREWNVRKLGGVEPKIVHVQDSITVAIGLSTGGFVRLESDFNDDATYAEQWTETEHRMNNWYSALLPVLSSSTDHPNEVLSFASIPQPGDFTILLTLSRDRTLRCWTPNKGCRSETILPPINNNTEAAPLLDGRPQKLLQAYVSSSTDVDKFSVIAFAPTPASATSGGIFHLYESAPGRQSWDHVASTPTSLGSAHCKLQDFLYTGGKLYVLWEKQGESMCEVAYFGAGVERCTWTPALYGQTDKLTQETVNEQLLQAGSLTDKFLQAILRPGVFSVLTLRSALQDYKEHYLSLPGPHPTQLVASYPTLAEGVASVVGCTVELTRDPLTGAALHKQYWNALRRDWEGFLARCREIERSARWPLCLGLGDTKFQVLLVERERIGQCVNEDNAIRLHRLLSSSAPRDSVHELLVTCWALRSRLSVPLIRGIESATLDLCKQEFAFPLADIVTDSSHRVLSNGDFDVDLDVWLGGKLAAVEDMDQAIRSILDVIVGLDKAVKQEEDEVELIIPPVTSEWSRALVTSYIAETVEARYQLCISLSTLLFFIGEGTKLYDPALLSEVFAVIRGVAMLRILSQQTAGDLEGARPSLQESDDVVARLNSLHMSKTGGDLHPTYSLLHQLLTQSGHSPLLPTAAHHFLDQLGLFNSVSPALATQSEVYLCERLRVSGYRETARSLLSWLPRTPAVCYVLGRLWLEVGRADGAVQLLQGVAGCFGAESGLGDGDRDALASVLPSGDLFRSECEYFLHIAEIFRNSNLTSYEISFTKLAISTWPEGEELSEISVTSWASVIKGYADLSLYEDAYCALIASPHIDQRHHLVSQLVYKMCEDGAVDRLLRMNFQGLVQEVELSLSFKARNADPRSRPNWSQILYTWYITRGDYRNAALVMYIRSKKLANLRNELTLSLELVEQQLDALNVALNALSLIDANNAYIIVPLQSPAPPLRKKRKIDNLIPEEHFTPGHRDVEVVNLLNIRKEYIHLSAIIELIRRDPNIAKIGEAALTAWATVSKLTQFGLFDLAIHTASALSVDMTEIFQRLTLQCLRLDSSSDSSLLEVAASDWLLTDKVSSWPGSPADRGWRYLRQNLDRYDNAETDLSYNKAVLETLLTHDAAVPLPPWLVQNISKYHPEHLIRTLLKYGNVEVALEHTQQLVSKVGVGNTLLRSRSSELALQTTSAWGASSSTQSGSTWLPYSLVDAVLKATEANISPKAQKTRQLLKENVSNRIRRMQKHIDHASSH